MLLAWAPGCALIWYEEGDAVDGVGNGDTMSPAPGVECTRNEDADMYCEAHCGDTVCADPGPTPIAWTCPGWTAAESIKVGCLYYDNPLPGYYCCP